MHTFLLGYFWTSYLVFGFVFFLMYTAICYYLWMVYIHTFTFCSLVINRDLGNPPKSWPMHCDNQQQKKQKQIRRLTLGKSRAHFCSLGASASPKTRQKSWCTTKNIWKEKICELKARWARQTDGQRVRATEWQILLCFGIGDTDMEHGQDTLTQTHTNSSAQIQITTHKHQHTFRHTRQS